MVNSFVNNFWDADWNGTKGYDILVTRLKDGKKLHDAYADFIRNRAKLEDDYGKNLIRLAQIAGGTEETGTLRQSWDSLKKETENIGHIHCELSKQLNELVERANAFREKQKRERLKIDEGMRREQNDKHMAHEKMVKVKRQYEQRCKESEAADEAYVAKAMYTPKEDEKLKKQKQRCKTAAESADSCYQSALKQLEDLRKKHIDSMEDACSKFQILEEGRITFLRNEFWLYANHGSTQILNIGERYESCRQVVEKCNETKDIQAFIMQNHTGSVRPSPILYENYYHKSGAKSSNVDSTNVLGELSKQTSVNLNPLTNSTQHAHSSTNPNHVPPRSQQQQQQLQQLYPNIHQQPQQTASSSSREATSHGSNASFVQAAFEYQSQGDQELSLRVGDVIEVLEYIDDTWGVGSLNGRVGVFPLAFVETVTPSHPHHHHHQHQHTSR